MKTDRPSGGTTDLLSALPVSLADQMDCVRREIALRERAYPRWIAAGKMTQAKAGREIELMRRVLATLEGLTGAG